ncbi:MAG: trigger factor [Nonlabens sp.]
MNIERTDIDNLNATLALHISQEDYKEQVDKILADYRKTANIPGFRKGHVPASLIKKKFGTSVLVEEINKIIQEKLNAYIKENDLNLLGNPLPKENNDIDWTGEDFTFEFEIGMAPDFEVELDKVNGVAHYEITTDEKTINDQLDRIREQYGKLISKDAVEEGDEITGVFRNDEEDINTDATFTISKLTDDTLEKIKGAKSGDAFQINTKELFKDVHDLQSFLKVDHDRAHDLDVKVTFEITEVNTREKAELNQEFFDKLFGEGKVNSEEELKDKLREEGKKQFTQQTDQKLLTDVTEYLIENTKFDLPADFLTRWIAQGGEKEMTMEEAAAEYERSEKGLRYQLIESTIVKNNEGLQLKFEDLQEYSRGMIKTQMAQYGHTDATADEVDQVVARIMSNQEEVKRMSEQLQNEKMLNFFKENVNLDKKELTYDEFIKEAYDA